MILPFLLLGCLGISFAALTQCPDLVPGTEMSLSHVDGFIGDRAVTATCSRGHFFDSGELIKYIECTNSTSTNGWIAAWNDTLGTCIEKMCPLITSVLGEGLSASDYEEISHYGNKATVSCSYGYGFEVNTSAPVESRVTSSINVTCEDDLSSITGAWSSVETCIEIYCDSPYDVNNAEAVYSTTSLGSKVIYECYAGYWFVSGIYVVIATCNSSAEWETENGPGWTLGSNVHCSRMDAYVGCLEADDLNVILNATTALGTDDCRSFCKERNYRYASLQGELCSCGDLPNQTQTEKAAEDCDTKCTDYEVNSTRTPVFCGSEWDAVSVYSSLAGCYRDITLPTTPGEPITEDYEVTCSERCRGKDEAFAAVKDLRCYCFNSTNVSGTETDKSKCSFVSDNTTSDFTVVYDLERIFTSKTNADFKRTKSSMYIDKWVLSLERSSDISNSARSDVTANNCDELFDMGVRMHGYYYLEEPFRKEFCHFKDGTVCEDGWVGLDGYCYLFGAGSLMNYSDARDFCISHNADLPSITTEDEFIFLKATRELFSDFWINKEEAYPKWWIGLYDSKLTKLYSWIDGNIMRFSAFADGHPSGDKDVQCGCDIPPYYAWFTVKCETMANVICKKQEGWNECMSFASPPTTQYSYYTEEMTLTICLEKCKGTNMSFAIIKDHDCWCADVVPSHTNLSRSDCMDSCPGDPIQHCGGPSDGYIVLKVSEQVTAKSCQDLQILGIGNDTYLTSQDGDTLVYEFCVVPECPYSWVSIGHHCYKFYPTATQAQAFTTCAENDAYMTTIETTEEINLLESTARNISIYSGRDAWRLGLQALNADGSNMRWSNGYKYEPEVWNGTFTLIEGPEVVLLMNASQLSAQNFNDEAFICERGLDYIGCYNITDILGDITYQSSKMTIQQCVELCRAKNRGLAFISLQDCSCEITLTEQEPGLCTHACPGQSNQVCGGDGRASVYNVSDFEEFARTCDDLFEVGIFISEEYIVNGTLETCVFIDQTNCSLGWFGYNGNCYQHFFASDSETNAEICANVNSIMTSLTSLDELEMLKDYLQKIQFELDTTYNVYTGISYGLYAFNVTISQDGLLMDPDVVSDGDVSLMDLHDYGFLTLHKSGASVGDGGVVCKQDRYLIGCYTTPNPGSFESEIANLQSMELTLCKQTCIAKSTEVALMGLTECYCLNLTEMSSLSVADAGSCNHPCPLVPEQTCGNGSVLWAHYTAVDEVPLANSCKMLYQDGVFYEQTYKLADPERLETCGFTDSNPCPVSWIGKNNKCLKILTSSAAFGVSRTRCSKNGGYLFNPSDQDVFPFLENVLIHSGLFDNITRWYTGIYPVFYNTSYATSRGKIITDTNFGPGTPPDSAVYYSSADSMWYAKQGQIPCICERDDDYVDCVDIHDTEDAAYSTDGNSLTMCIYWCLGQNYSYSAVSGTNCKCFEHDIASYVHHQGSCSTSCSGIHTQICGESHHHHYTYVRTENVSFVPETCSRLFLHGVFAAGNYWILHDEQEILVECFTGGELDHVILSTVKTVHASSSKSGHDVSKASLSYPFNTAWKPHENEHGTWFGIKVSEWYVVAGIRMMGIHTQSEQSYIKTYKVKYRNLLTGAMEYFLYNSTDEVWPGCESSIEVCSAYPSDPVVTMEITIYPETWHSAISMQILVYGQKFASFNHEDPYLGCYLDGHGLFTEEGANITLDECLSLCRNSSKQFAGIGEHGSCLCGEISADYGYVTEDYCPENETSSYRVGSDSLSAVALYRTYESLKLGIVW